MSKYRVVIKSKILAHQWWGQQWCKNIENYADYSNRLERGRTYLRSGKVHDITIEQSDVIKVAAKVDGSACEPYDTGVFIKPLSPDQADGILSKIVNLNVFKDGFVPEDYKFLFSIEEGGLFPTIDEIGVFCSCPDVAYICKHVAAVLYAIGSILDQEPLLLFELRGIDVDTYLDAEVREKTNNLLIYAKNFNDEERLIEDDLVSEIFGIDIGELHSAERSHVNQELIPVSNDEVRTIIIDPAAKVYHPRKKVEKPKKERIITPDRFVIRQYALDGTFIAQYESYDEATEKTGVIKRTIQRNVCGEKKSGGGFIWKKEPANTTCGSIPPLSYNSDPQKKPVCQYQYNGILVAEYSSISEAARETGINLNGIRSVLKGQQKQAGGYVWEYKKCTESPRGNQPVVRYEESTLSNTVIPNDMSIQRYKKEELEPTVAGRNQENISQTDNKSETILKRLFRVFGGKRRNG